MESLPLNPLGYQRDVVVQMVVTIEAEFGETRLAQHETWNLLAAFVLDAILHQGLLRCSPICAYRRGSWQSRPTRHVRGPSRFPTKEKPRPEDVAAPRVPATG